jgi:hypothetical protein
MNGKLSLKRVKINALRCKHFFLKIGFRVNRVSRRREEGKYLYL